MNWWMYLLDVSGGCNWWMWFTSSCDWIEAFFCQKLWHSTVFFHQRYCWSKNSNTLDFRCFSKNRVGFDIFLAHDFPCFFKYIYHVYILFNINIFSYSYILQTCNTYIIYKHVYMDIYILIYFCFVTWLDQQFFAPKNTEFLLFETLLPVPLRATRAQSWDFAASWDGEIMWAMKKPWLVRLHSGLYYPVMWGL